MADEQEDSWYFLLQAPSRDGPGFASGTEVCPTADTITALHWSSLVIECLAGHLLWHGGCVCEGPLTNVAVPSCPLLSPAGRCPLLATQFLPTDLCTGPHCGQHEGSAPAPGTGESPPQFNWGQEGAFWRTVDSRGLCLTSSLIFLGWVTRLHPSVPSFCFHSYFAKFSLYPGAQRCPFLLRTPMSGSCREHCQPPSPPPELCRAGPPGLPAGSLDRLPLTSP